MWNTIPYIFLVFPLENVAFPRECGHLKDHTCNVILIKSSISPGFMSPIFLQVKIWRIELYCRVWSCFAIWSPFPGSLEIGPLLLCRHARQSGRLHRSQAIFAAEEEVGKQCACHRTGQVQMCPHFMEYDSEASSLPWTWHLDTFLFPFIENQQWQSDGLDSS